MPSSPSVSIVDLREEFEKKNFSPLSELLQQKIQAKLNQHEQILLFLNKRGFYSALVCRDCGFTPRCPNCDIALTYHRVEKKFNTQLPVSSFQFPVSSFQLPVSSFQLPVAKLICHYCGRLEVPPTVCPNCKSAYIRYFGIGTQRLEQECKNLFPAARVLRVDRDTTTGKKQHAQIYQQIKNHTVDIIIGTQIIAKGLDIPEVALVGVILADLSLSFPEFRAGERTFQLLTQVAGRTGRPGAKNPGEIVIQTYNPANPYIQTAAARDYQKFYVNEIIERKRFGYPPFAQIIKLTYEHMNLAKCRQETERIFETLKQMNTRTNEHKNMKNHKRILKEAERPEDSLVPSSSVALAKEGWNIKTEKLMSQREGKQEKQGQILTVPKGSDPVFSRENENDKKVEIYLVTPLISKIYNKYRLNIILKGQNPHQLLENLPLPSGWKVDVDPENIS